MKITTQQEAIHQVKQYVGTSHAGYIQNRAIEDDDHFLVLVEAEGLYPYLVSKYTGEVMPTSSDNDIARNLYCEYINNEKRRKLLTYDSSSAIISS